MTPRATRFTALIALGAMACRPTPFQRYVSEERWSDAARAFGADSSLMDNERALYEAGLLFSSPARGEYDPARADRLLRRLLTRFPSTSHRVEATDRLALLERSLHDQDSTAAYTRSVQARIQTLAADSIRMHAVLDSLTTRNAQLERNTARLEADVRERDDQLRALRIELERLKAIDLKPRPPRPRV
jgi:hypothetical protein